MSYFREPIHPDPTWARPEEDIPRWLSRSTHTRARDIRNFLNFNLSCLPVEIRGDFHQNLIVRWQSGFFELVIARLLQLLGGYFEVEAINSEGRRSDFTALLKGKHYVIEAVAPEFNRETSREEAAHRELIRIIEKHVPAGWGLLLKSLPDFHPNQSKRPLKAALREMASIPCPGPSSDLLEICIDTPQGTVEGTLVPGEYGGNSIIGGPTYTSWDDSDARILNSLRKKRAQTRSEPYPVIIALHASGLSSSFENFDKVLFGHTVGHYGSGREESVTFEADGLFARKPENRSFAGVLAFTSVSPFGVAAPVLYLHPEVTGPLDGFDVLEKRVLGPHGILRIQASGPNPLRALRFPSL